MVDNSAAHQNVFGQIDQYQILERVGEGTYGVVYKGVHQTTKETIALKEIKLETQSEGVPSTTIREISVLNEIDRHENVVQLKVVIMRPTKMYLVFEYMDLDLAKMIGTLISGQCFPPMLVKWYMY